jgi:hypothetical protein
MRAMGRKLVLYVFLVCAIGGVEAVRGQEVPITFITVADVHRLIERGTKVLFVDVRGQQEYLARHIKGAISMPLRTLPERYQEIPKGPLVVLY